MSDEEDYMSEKFLAGLTDVRPSLIQNRAKKRQVEVSTKQADNTKRQREQRLNRTGENANEKLQESLKQAINSDNKGFQMLTKMGYKAGQALGKATNTDTGSSIKRLLEPIGISIKQDRSGLGREAALHELKEKRILLHKKRLEKAAGVTNITTEEYRKRAKEKAEERLVLGALKGCQKTCENLDVKNNVKIPYLKWFWPERDTTDETVSKEEQLEVTENDMEVDEEEQEENYTNAEKLDMLTSYLRTSYIFCFWCGVEYQNEQDLNSNCPGLTRDDH